MMDKRVMVAIGMLVILAYVVGTIIGSQATPSAAAVELQYRSGENNDTHHRDMHGENNDTHHRGMHGENNDTHHRGMHGEGGTHH